MKNKQRTYSNKEFFEALQLHEREAKDELFKRLYAFGVKTYKEQKFKQRGFDTINHEDEDIISTIKVKAVEALNIFLEKIDTKNYEYRGLDPATFAIEILKNKLGDLSRKKIPISTEELPNVIGDYSINKILENKMDVEYFLKEMKKKCPNCALILEIFYLEDMTYDEILSSHYGKLFKLTKVDELKKFKYKCIKKLQTITGIKISK